MMHAELLRLRRDAQEARVTQQRMHVRLLQQDQLNRQLLSENKMLWQTVPHKEVFHSSRSRYGSCSSEIASRLLSFLTLFCFLSL